MEITRSTITDAKARYFGIGKTVRYLAPERDSRVLTCNYRMPKVPRADRQETAMSRVIKELERLST